jgi:5'-nucleotidase
MTKKESKIGSKEPQNRQKPGYSTASKRPFLLLTNDDGIHSPGIVHLWQAVREFADVCVIAPAFEKSGSSMSITWTKPLTITPIAWEGGVRAWSLNGAPADCVKMALSAPLLERRPDMIISGVNRGSNLGQTVLYSGTVGACIEGSLKSIPSIAFSFCDLDPPPLSVTKDYIFPLIQYFLQHPFRRGTLLNVTFPHNCKEGVKGVRMARQGKGQWAEAPEKRIHPEGEPYYWLGGKWHSSGEEPDSDVALSDEGYIAVAPIYVGDLTDQSFLAHHKPSLDKFFDDRAKLP